MDMDGETPWTDHVIRGSPARRDFPKNPPKLDDLILARILIASSRIHVVVRFRSLPEGTPPKWAANNYHQLDLIFQFDLPKLILFDVKDYLNANIKSIRISIKKCIFSIWTKDNVEFVRLQFKSVYAVFVPDETRQIDELMYDFSGSDIETY